MEPLYENHFTIDRDVLLEWYNKEFYRDNRFFVGIHAGLILAYLLLAGLVFVNRWLMPTALAVGAAALFLVLAALFLLNLLLRCRIQVMQLLKGEEGKRFPLHVGMVYYADFAMAVGEEPGSDPAGRMLACVSRAAGLRRGVEAVMAEVGKQADRNPAQMEALRPRMVALQRQLEALSAEAGAIGGQQHNFSELSGYARTGRLHILHFGESAVLAAKDGFTLGDDAGFTAYIKEKLAAAAEAAKGEKVRKGLKKALERYYK